MPGSIRAVKLRVGPKDLLNLSALVASLTLDISGLLQFTPASAAASILLSILETVQALQNNKEACFRIARRAARILVDLKQRMEGRWESAPKALVDNIHNFEKTLVSVRDFMQELLKIKWMGRFLKKTTIENALDDYAALLDEAERSFQIATLVEIHYAIGNIRSDSSSGRGRSLSKDSDVTTLPPYESDSKLLGPEKLAIDTKIDPSNLQTDIVVFRQEAPTIQPMIIPNVTAVADGLANLDDPGFGFRRYHQSEVRMKSPINVSEGFWSDTSKADVEGQKMIVKRYEGPREIALKQWLHDVHHLRDLYHPNLPQMIGFSNAGASTPFILLHQVQLRDMNAFMWKLLQTESLSKSTTMLLRMYRDISSAALYAKRQFNLSDSKTQDFVDGASYHLDGDNNVLVGLPPPRDGTWMTARSYGLTESFVGRCLQTLPASSRLDSLPPADRAEVEKRLKHVKALAQLLLPQKSDRPELPRAISDLIGDEDDPSIPLLRSSVKQFDFAWHANVSNNPIRFQPGDIGFFKTGSLDFEGFEKVGNVLEAGWEAPAPFGVVRETTGMEMKWVNGFMQRRDLWPFVLPDDIEGWMVIFFPHEEVSINVRHTQRLQDVHEARTYLKKEARSIAKTSGIAPHELVLVTSATLGQIYSIKHFGPPPVVHLPPGRPAMVQPRFGALPLMGFNAHQHHHHQQQNQFGRGNQFVHAPPTPFTHYLFTSHRAEHVPFWSASPSCPPPGQARPPLGRSIVTRVNWARPEQNVSYIQLSEEDFV